MEAKHTPGPWMAKKEKVLCEKHWTVIAHCSDYVDGPDDIPAEANAKLIAAAPELLSELKAALRIFERDMVKARPDQYERIRAAISKAEARQ